MTEPTVTVELTEMEIRALRYGYGPNAAYEAALANGQRKLLDAQLSLLEKPS